MAAPAKYKKRPDGNYQTSITIGRRPDGKPIRKTIYAKTIKELDAKAAEYRQQLERGTLSSNEKMTFGELAALWISEYKPTVEGNTRKMYASLLDNHLLPELAAVKLKDLKPHNLQSIINRLAGNGYAEKTLKKIKVTGTQILDLAVDNDLIFRNVFAKVEIPHIEAEERRALTQEEIDLITSTYTGHRMGIPALLMLYCGLRRGELVALTWGDIDLKAKTVTVNKAVFFDGNAANLKGTKSKAGMRTVPIPDMLIPILKGRRAASLMVCPSSTGEMMTQAAFKRAWESYWRYLNIQAGGSDKKRGKNVNGKPTWLPAVHAIDNITPHMLRHTYCTMLYDAGVDVKSAQRFMGHADIQTTLRIYTHLSEEKEQAAVDALNAHLGKQKAEKNRVIKI